MPRLPRKVGDQPQPSASPGPTRHQYQPSAVSARHATQSKSPCNQVPPLPHKVKDHVTKCHACHATCAVTSRNPARDQYQPSAQCHACHAKSKSMSPSATPAMQSASPCHQVPRLPCRFQAQRPGAHTAPNDARAYIRPLGEPEVPRLPRKMQAERPGANGAPRDARATSDPFSLIDVSVVEVSVLEVSVLDVSV